ncbi:MAG: helix-turn-helix domain-containing protein [Defluviitaleaceae bacterium]|nr:helix-turn-helix domain-containing protein [Defluviitaleaceae bacterium]
MDFDWITPEEAAQKWGIKARQVQALCSQGKIPGVVRLSRAWLIPKDAVKPRDGRYKNGRVPTKNKAENKESEKA